MEIFKFLNQTISVVPRQLPGWLADKQLCFTHYINNCIQTSFKKLLSLLSCLKQPIREQQTTITLCTVYCYYGCCYYYILICLYVRPSQFKGQLVARMHVTPWQTCKFKARKEGRIEPLRGSIRPRTRVSSYGLDSTMNLDANVTKRREEKRKKEKYGSLQKVNS